MLHRHAPSRTNFAKSSIFKLGDTIASGLLPIRKLAGLGTISRLVAGKSLMLSRPMLCGVTWRRWFRPEKQHSGLGDQTSKHQCTNNVHPRSQNGLHQPSQSQNQFLLTVWNRAIMRILNMLPRWLSGPEKAGVGGSSPSLATTLSISNYRRPKTSVSRLVGTIREHLNGCCLSLPIYCSSMR